MIIVSAGIRPRDELATRMRNRSRRTRRRPGQRSTANLRSGHLRHWRSRPACRHDLRPGCPRLRHGGNRRPEFARQDVTFRGADLSTKLKLMGIDVASFGNYEAGPEIAQPLVFEDPFGGVYKKLLFNHAGTKLLGGVLVGDASDYGTLLAAGRRAAIRWPYPPGELIVGKRRRRPIGDRIALGRRGQVCSCNNVTKGQLCAAIREGDLTTLGRSQILHEGRHRLRRLPAAGHRSAQRRTRRRRQDGQQEPVRTFSAHAARAVRDRQDQGTSRRSTSCSPRMAGAGLRNLQAGGGFDSGQPVERSDHGARSTHAARYERPLPGQHSTRRTLFGGAARARRRNHARQACYARPGRQEVRPLHQDHRRPAHRSVWRAGASVARDLGEAGRCRLRERPCLWQVAAHGEELRRHDLVPLRRARFGRLGDSHRRALPRHPRAAQAQDGGRRGCVRECAEAQMQGLWPDRHRERATTCTSAATAAPSRVMPICWPAISTKKRPSTTSTAS